VAKNPHYFKVTINKCKLEWYESLKYLGCTFVSQSCCVDYSSNTCTFCGNFNNILSVIGRGKKEMATVYLAKTLFANVIVSM